MANREDSDSSVTETPDAATLPSGAFAAALEASHIGKCLDGTTDTANGSNVYQWDCNGQNQQTLTFTPATGKPNVYTIKSKHSGRCLGVQSDGYHTNGGNILSWDCGGGADQQYKIESVGNGLYKLVAQHSGRVVDVDGNKSDNGANVHQWNY